MSLDIAAGAKAAAPLSLQYVTVEIMPLVSGHFSVSMQATLLDEQELEFVGEDLAQQRVATVDELLALIREHVRMEPSAAPPSLS